MDRDLNTTPHVETNTAHGSDETCRPPDAEFGIQVVGLSQPDRVPRKLLHLWLWHVDVILWTILIGLAVCLLSITLDLFS
jgi:hypothetical protein